MDYASFRRFRDGSVGKRRLLRLDCMNPVRALAAWPGYPIGPAEDAPPGSMDQALEAWSKVTGLDGGPDHCVVGPGVRELLAAICSVELGAGREVWLPEDVYPVYAELAQNAGSATRAFATLPRPDWAFLEGAGDRAAAVIPLPLSPLGRWPTSREAESFLSWLEFSPGRLLIVDAVYVYDFATARALLRPLCATGRCVVLWSCSKSWLHPNVLGVAVAPAGLAARLRSRVEPPGPVLLGSVTGLLRRAPDLPRRQQEAFEREWRRLAPFIRAADSRWSPPETGYFSVVQAPFETLLELHGTLAVPATVFGSRRGDFSVATCLHDLAGHEGARVDA